MSNFKNALIGQSGGPTAVINASLAGAIQAYLSQPFHGTIFGAKNGIKGALKGNLISLNETFEDSKNIQLLMQTPSAYLGSCRYRLGASDEKEFDALFDTFQKNNIEYFFYIGGNDSMDTVLRLSKFTQKTGIRVIGIPKTIDNDLLGTDHCPGYGSSAKFIATTISEMAQDAGCYDIKNVLIVEIMGRNAGWLTAASALARSEHCSAPDLIYLPERAFDENRFVFDLRQKLAEQNTVIVAVSEGIKTADGLFVSQDNTILKEDMFGHGQLGGAGKKLELLVKNKLGVKVRSVELNIPQRCGAHIMSATDVQEAFDAGKTAVEAAIRGESGKMVSINRSLLSPYRVQYALMDIASVANGEKAVPDNFISSEGNDITSAFTEYAYPLIQGERDIIFKDGIPDFLRI